MVRLECDGNEFEKVKLRSFPDTELEEDVIDNDAVIPVVFLDIESKLVNEGFRVLVGSLVNSVPFVITEPFLAHEPISGERVMESVSNISLLLRKPVKYGVVVGDDGNFMTVLSILKELLLVKRS